MGSADGGAGGREGGGNAGGGLHTEAECDSIQNQYLSVILDASALGLH